MNSPFDAIAASMPATREAALVRLANFVPHAGDAYAQWRNYDFGAGQHRAVSGLAPYIRHRLITEEDVVRAVLGQHSPQAAEKFIQEVYWRTYWKGWLEIRPSVWADYLDALDQLGPPSAEAIAAMAGKTGIACFDHWANELVETGYLHNHARMWFASIWIFTLGLPWQWGADFFMQHLLDGDPASNTLGWRWVAGLQTPGKTYLAQAENIETFTQGRFKPAALRHGPAPTASANPAAGALPNADAAPDAPFLLLLTTEDLHPESLPLNCAHIAGLAGLMVDATGLSPRVAHFRVAALDDGMQRASLAFGRHGPILPAHDIAGHAQQLGVRHIVTAYAPIGPIATMLAQLAQACAQQGLKLHQVRRDWDSTAWPLATKGFFPFRQHIPDLLPK